MKVNKASQQLSAVYDLKAETVLAFNSYFEGLKLDNN